MKGNYLVLAGTYPSLVFITLIFSEPAAAWAGTFFDDFNDGVADGWTVLEQPVSEWETLDGGYFGEIFEGAEGVALIGEPDWQVSSIEVKIRDIQGEWFAVVWNWQDVNNFDGWWINANGSTLEAWPKIGVYEASARVAEPIPLDIDSEHTVEVVIDEDIFEAYFDGELAGDYTNDLWTTGQVGLLVWNGSATFDDVRITGPSVRGLLELRAGDADQDLDFDQLDLVKVQIAGKYVTGQAASWGEGDWDGAPGGEPGSPPGGNGLFDQLDIIAALSANTYLMGRYAASSNVASGPAMTALAGVGVGGDGQTCVVYDTITGQVAVDTPAGVALTSINIDSATGIFDGDAARNLGGSFDNDADGNIFKATFGGSFGSISFGNIAQTGLSRDFVLGDLTVVGSLAGGGDLGNVDLIYVPEPASLKMVMLGALLCLKRRKYFCR